jgi:hypothetical protein
VRKVKAHTEVNATCFFQRGQRRGSLGSVFDGCGTRMSSDASPSVELFAVEFHQHPWPNVLKNNQLTSKLHSSLRAIQRMECYEFHDAHRPQTPRLSSGMHNPSPKPLCLSTLRFSLWVHQKIKLLSFQHVSKDSQAHIYQILSGRPFIPTYIT